MSKSSTASRRQAEIPRVDLNVSVSDLVRRWAQYRGDGIAYRSTDHNATWAQYDAYANWIASQLSSDDSGGPVAVFVPDSPDFHAALRCPLASYGLVGPPAQPHRVPQRTR